MSQTARLLLDSQCQLGEGPVWHDGRQQLFFLDINEQTLFAVTADGEIADSWLFNENVAAVAIHDDDTLVLVTDTGLKHFDIATGGMNRINEIEADRANTRGNDSRVHPSGAFWIGTMDRADEDQHSGSLYHFRNDVLTTLKSPVQIPNATCFSPDGKIAYWTDTPTQKIMQVATDPATGLPIGEWTLFADVSDGPGYPDGAVVDSEGYLWNARWGGSCVVRHAPDGSVDRVIQVPVSQVTCPAFGGKDLKTLFITTAAKNLSEDQLAAEKHAGSLFAVDLDVAGQPEARIAL
ncbi:MAG: SMP-30/gluconolactonase/LRE family protein [Candidatus Devosia phytovorans]|uniref:SMP-30/gluconolactonase/LRE family protein n=1 Tax=Candidatus Devosia phytovorans TaxID=3121372 RepID=A0AAJ6B157_9HYPH|nr:SMP-30/gluconolactonase/LRE family protein [Devosia sp.]WEK05932.1 MAG: SMP-30/gluconolactonase/LRE family protein [Devosia sp.]